MAEESQEEIQEEQPKKKSGFKGTLIMVSIMVLVPAILGLIAYYFVLAPLLSDEVPQEVVQTAPLDELPDTFALVDFDQKMATVLTDAEDDNRMLMYRISMAVTDVKTSEIITARKQLFESILVRAHNNHSQSQLNDTNVQAKILKQIKQDANTLLKKLAPDNEGAVHQVLHLAYNIVPL